MAQVWVSEARKLISCHAIEDGERFCFAFESDFPSSCSAFSSSRSASCNRPNYKQRLPGSSGRPPLYQVFLHVGRENLTVFELQQRLHMRLRHVRALVRGRLPLLDEQDRIISIACQIVVVAQAAVFPSESSRAARVFQSRAEIRAPTGLCMVGDKNQKLLVHTIAPLRFLYFYVYSSTPRGNCNRQQVMIESVEHEWRNDHDTKNHCPAAGAFAGFEPHRLRQSGADHGHHQKKPRRPSSRLPRS